MTGKIYIVTDLGPGDGGKGGVVHKIATMTGAHTVLKVGGAQGSHGVSTSRGESYAFSQWGCGTFEGIKTHITPQMIISPVGILHEAECLRYQGGVHEPFDLLTIDERALCATPYHGIASRLKEMARGKDSRGTVGTGVGEAFRDSINFPELIIKAKDLSLPGLKEKLAAVRELKIKELTGIIGSGFLTEDRSEAKVEIEWLYDDGYLEYAVEQFRKTGIFAKVVDQDYLRRKIFSIKGTAVVESSHGVLTDNQFGFHPHTSAIRTLPCFRQEMLSEADFKGQIVNVAVFRAYQIRHGAGPMPTADPEMGKGMLPGSHKPDNRYQGKARFGPLDIVLLKYAIEACGGPQFIDGLAVTWFDQIQSDGVWHICDRYRGADDPNFFTKEGNIKVYRGGGKDQLQYQEELGRKLLGCKPEIMSYEIPLTAGRDELYSLCAEVLKEKLGIPVRMVSFGPTERDKICK